MSTVSNEQNNPPPASPPPSGARRTGRLVALAAIFGAIIFVCINLISSTLFRSARIDVTQQHLYSLSNGTRALLAQIQEPIRFRFFMSSQLTREAPQLAAFANRVRSMLDAYVAASHGKIVLEVIDPKPYSADEDRAVAFGVSQYQASSGDRVFFGLAATNSTDGKATIATFTPDREPFLEYDLTRMVAELGRRGKAVVAVIDGLGLSGNPQFRIPEQQTLVQLKQFFDVKLIGGDVDELPKDTKVLMIVHPQKLTDRTLYTIDQWVVHGGATMVFVDPRAETQIGFGGRPPADASSDLGKLFKTWGVEFDPKKAVADLAYAFKAQRMIDGRPVTMINLPWMALRKEAFNQHEATLAQLQAIVVTTAGSFTATGKDASLRPLISASTQGGQIDVAKVSDSNADLRDLINQIRKPKEPPVLAARLVGKLKSAFADKPKDSKFAAKHDAGGDAPANVILVGDADMLMDRNWVQQRDVLGTQVAQAFANNGDFVVNSIEQMVGGPALSDLRGRGVSWRPFETIQAMEAEASKKYSAKEEALTKRLKETELKLTELSKQGPAQKAGAPDVLSDEQVKAIEKFRTDLLATRAELRQVQYALRSNVDQLKGWITAINVGGVPLLAGAIALGFALRRPRRPLPKRDPDGTGKPASPEADPQANLQAKA